MNERFRQPVFNPPQPSEVWFCRACKRIIPFSGLPPVGTCNCAKPDPYQPNKSVVKAKKSKK